MARARSGKSRRQFIVESIEPRVLLSKTVYVDVNASGAAHDGTSWTSAFTDLQQGLAAAVSGDEIHVADGTYKPTSGTDRSASFSLKKAVTLYGGYAGYGAGNPDARSVSANPVILSGDIGTPGDINDNSYHAVKCLALNLSTILDGFTITAGSANKGSEYSGGGLYISDGPVTVRNCTFRGNFGVDGGGVYCLSSSPLLTNCIFVGNAATYGGGIDNDYSSNPTLINCTFSSNSSIAGSAIRNNGTSSPTLTNCIAWGCGDHAIDNSAGVPTISYCDVEGGCSGVGNLNVDPTFVRSPWTGPDGVWCTGDDDYGDLRLRSGSPASNAGSNSAVPVGVTTDLSGNTRIQSSTVDLGAYEGSFAGAVPRLIYVDVHSNGANSGSSWTNAFTSLQSALVLAGDGDTIRIADGTYLPTLGGDRSMSFALKGSVKIFGGYAGFGAADPDARDVSAWPTVLSGDIGVSGTSTDNSYHVVTAVCVGSAALVDGLTITSGCANGTGADQQTGGGFYSQNGSVTFNDCSFLRNTASGEGGAAYNSSSSTTLTNCAFNQNTSSSSGGGIYNYFSTPSLSNCVFTGNSSSSSGGGMCDYMSPATLENCECSGNAATSGGGMYDAAAGPPSVASTLTNCSFVANTATNGGGLYVSSISSSASPTLTDCLFSANSASAGGGMYNSSYASPLLSHCTFSRNSASSSGGAMENYRQSSPELIECAFMGNSAVYLGGGMFDSTNCAPQLTNCILSGNAALTGGGIYNQDSSTTLTNCALAGNTAPSGGPALYNTNSSATLTNCIVWGSGTNSTYCGTGTTQTVSYSDIEGGYAGAGNFSVIPSFVRSPWIGSDCKWGTADDDYGDLRLRTGSPAIDAGLNSAIPAGVDTDISGSARIQGGTVDLGAYEGSFVAPDPSLIYVDVHASGSNTGKSWADAFMSLQSGLAAAKEGDTIRVADGVYLPTLGNDRAASVAMKTGVTVQGGYAGFGADDPNLRDTKAFPTVLSGDIGEPGSTSDNSYHVVIAVSLGGVAVLDGMTITLGNANGTGANQSLGGGLFAASGSPTLVNCQFTANAGNGAYFATCTPSLTDCEFSNNATPTSNPNISGGGIYVGITCSATLESCHFTGNSSDDGGGLYNAGSVTLSDCTFRANTAVYGGGGLSSPGSASLTDCTFSQNTSSNYGGEVYCSGSLTTTFIRCAINGGGMFVSGCSPTLTDCTFEGNTNPALYMSSSSATLTRCTFTANVNGAVSNNSSSPTFLACTFDSNLGTYGGGIYNSQASPRLTDCIFTRNSSSYGAGIYNTSGSSPILTGCTFSGNAAGSGGAMYNQSNSSPMITNCRFGGNTASGSGGAIYNASGSSPTLINCTISGSTASSGGGMYNTASSPTLINCTLTGNTATSRGSATDNESASAPTLKNCIIWGTSASPIYNSTSTPSITDCDVKGGYAGVGNLDADPLFIRSPWTGPDGTFGTVDDDYGDLRLRDSSPLLNLGSNAAIPVGITTDLAGNTRIVDGTVDLGAYEGAFATASARIVYVDINAPGADNGTSWMDAFTNLQSAMSIATDGDVIRIADGTYKPTSGTDRDATFALRTGVCLLGSYAGYGASNPDARDLLTLKTTLSGDIGTAGDNSDNSYHVMTAVAVGALTRLDGLTIAFGSANLTTIYQGRGAGLYEYGSSPTLVNCAFAGNTASSSGGGIYNSASSPSLTNCKFVGNTAAYGAGVYNYYYSSPVATNCTFSGNVASYGAGIYNASSSSPTVTNCIIWGNSGTSISNNASGTPPVTYSDIQGDYSGIGNVNLDPQFVRTPWTGPDGLFGTVDDDWGDLRLRSGSVGLDAGSNAAVPGSVTTDIAGNPRVQNGTVDLGAYEGAVAVSAPKVIYVDHSSAGLNDGSSWTNAYASLQSALIAAGDGDTIRIADGIYTPTTGLDRTMSFALRWGVSLYGGYAGYGASNPDARDVAAYATILSGDIGTPGDASDNSYHVVTATGIAQVTVIDGLSVVFGNANGTGTNQRNGGGLLAMNNASLSLANCAFRDNVADFSGGGIYSYSSSLTLTSCIFRGNLASRAASPYGGGGMYSSGGSSVVNSCTFNGNTAYTGGGMCNSGSSPTLINCSFSGNIAGAGGGMFNVYSSAPRLTNCTFSANAATARGGAIFNSTASPILTNCTLIGNTASLSAGGMYNDASSSPVVTNCIIWGSGGSLIVNSSSTPTVTYSDIEGGYSGTGNINADPLFVASPGDLRLQMKSPCIDAGNNSAVPVGVTTDAQASPRIVDCPGMNDPGAIVDMGAYERVVPFADGAFIVDSAKPSVKISFNRDVLFSSLAPADLLLVNRDTGLPIDCGSDSFVTYDAATRGAMWQFTRILPDGNYTATLPAGNVLDTAAHPILTADLKFDFFVLAGDANRDRKVNINDLAILSMNWQGSGKDFSQGDFNYDGKVDAVDLGILSSHWQQALPPPPASAPVSIVRAPTRTATRIVSVVL